MFCSKKKIVINIEVRKQKAKARPRVPTNKLVFVSNLPQLNVNGHPVTPVTCAGIWILVLAMR